LLRRPWCEVEIWRAFFGVRKINEVDCCVLSRSKRKKRDEERLRFEVEVPI